MIDISLNDILQQTGHSQADLARLVGSSSRASEYLSGKRTVPIGDRRLIMSQWGVSAEDVIRLPVKKSTQSIPSNKRQQNG